MNINVTQHGNNGWEFSITQNGETRQYRTNEQGRGLWELLPRPGAYSDNDTEYRQIEGTAQFELPRNRSAAYAKIRRHFVETV